MVYSGLGACLTRHSSGTRPEAGEPLNFTLGAMRNMFIFSVTPVAVFAAGSVAGSGVLASILAGGFERVLLVQLFFRAASFSVSRSSFLRSLLHRAPLVFSCGSFAPFFLQRSVAGFASNFTLKRDAPKAARPLAPR